MVNTIDHQSLQIFLKSLLKLFQHYPQVSAQERQQCVEMYTLSLKIIKYQLNISEKKKKKENRTHKTLILKT